MARARMRWEMLASKLALAGASLLAATACSVIESLDGYADGVALDAGATHDAAIDTGGGADAGGAPDGNGDGDGDARVDAGNLPFCASLVPAPLFCDDFDGADLALKWDEVNATGGQPSRVTTAFTSPPFGLQVAVKPLGTTDPLWATLIKRFPAFAGKPLRAEARFQLRIDVADTNAGSTTVLWALHYEDTNYYWEVQLVAKYDGNVVSFVVAEVGKDATVGNFYHDATLGHTMLLGEWHRLRADVVLGRLGGPPLGANMVKVYFDGALDTTLPLPSPIVSSEPRLALGVGYVHTPSTPWTILYDDAMLDLVAQ